MYLSSHTHYSYLVRYLANIVSNDLLYKFLFKQKSNFYEISHVELLYFYEKNEFEVSRIK